MHAPPPFREERIEVLAAAIRDIRLAALVTPTAEGIVASHVPMVLKMDGDGFAALEAHVARANRHWAALDGAAPSLAIFQGPQAYISPAWYESKRRHGKVMPTWSYTPCTRTAGWRRWRTRAGCAPTCKS